MGLRFRKSISIIPGVTLNFGKTGMSVSTGVPGFRKTFHTSGKVTTSIGIPGLVYTTLIPRTQRHETAEEALGTAKKRQHSLPISQALSAIRILIQITRRKIKTMTLRPYRTQVPL